MEKMAENENKKLSRKDLSKFRSAEASLYSDQNKQVQFQE